MNEQISNLDCFKLFFNEKLEETECGKVLK